MSDKGARLCLLSEIEGLCLVLAKDPKVLSEVDVDPDGERMQGFIEGVNYVRSEITKLITKERILINADMDRLTNAFKD